LRLRAQRIISGADPADRRSIERLLDYPLHAPRHLALVAWNPAPGESSEPSLRSTVDQIYRNLGAAGPTLALPVGAHAMWSWRALERAPLLLSRADLRLDGRRVALGQVGTGLAGFPRSHGRPGRSRNFSPAGHSGRAPCSPTQTSSCRPC